MQNKKSLIFILLPVFVILILVIIKSLNKDNFELDTKQALEISLKEHVLSLNQLKAKLQKPKGISLIDLRNANDFNQTHLKNAVNIPFSEILKNSELKKLKSDEKEIILYSNSAIESAKAWILLTQMGYINLYLLDIPEGLISDSILNKDTALETNETLKYKFQPDTLVGLE
jgi:phage shock protein E